MAAVTEKTEEGEANSWKIGKPSSSSLQAINKSVEVKPNSVLEEAGHESILDLVDLEGGSSFHEPSIVGYRAVNALAMGETLMRTLFGRVSFMDFLDNHYGLQPMCSSCGDVGWHFDRTFPVQMIDRLIVEEEAYFYSDVEIIPVRGAESEMREPYRAYRWIAWNQLKVLVFASASPERFNHKLAMHFGFLQEVVNGPPYSVVTFANKKFIGFLVDPSISSIALPNDIFMIVMKGSLEIDIYPPKRERTENLNAKEGVKLAFRRWLNGLNCVCGWNEKQAIGYVAEDLRKRFVEQLAAVKLDLSELGMVCALARP
ncbi:unnamed protein product [Taenia asiatica]|uniref:F-box protein n=1 Tax=Taenia asiatica TaxID=60517 RepID=A0A0R3WDK0_TAEAS|nr:unnamed protein product [Taenia asiatica]